MAARDSPVVMEASLVATRDSLGVMEASLVAARDEPASPISLGGR